MITVSLDVDEVLMASGRSWMAYLETITGVKLTATPTNYDLSVYFKSELDYEGLDGFEYWRSEDPYKNTLPVEGAVKGCQQLAEMGFRLLPVSKIYAEHANSKRKALKKYFPMLDEPIYISLGGRKSDVRCDYIVDDRHDNLLGFDKTLTKGLILKTPYMSIKPLDIDCVICNDWSEIVGHLAKSYKTPY